MLEVAVEAGVIDGVERAEAHRDGGVFPVVGHEARVGVAGQPVAADLHAEVVELLFGEATFQEGAGVDAGGVVALDVDVVAGDAVGFASEKPVEAHFVERGGRGEGGKVPTDAVIELVGSDDHDGGIPADETADAPLNVHIAGEERLVLGWDGVDVGSADGEREADLQLIRPLHETADEKACPLFPR